jgi:hypothetical protein
LRHLLVTAVNRNKILVQQGNYFFL